MITTNQRAIDLMPQLRDILHLPEDLDLPKLASIAFNARTNDPGWTVNAQLDERGGIKAWEALRAWAPGVEPYLSDFAPSVVHPSGTWRQASVTVVIAEVSVKVWAHMDGEFIPPGWCCADSYRLKDACAECSAGPVHVTGPVADVLIGGVK